MILRDKIDILKPVQTKDESIGRVITTYPVDKSIRADFQPLTYNIQRKPYGITDKTSHLIFCKDFGITAANRIGFEGKQYSIDSILHYKSHIEIYVQVVI